MSDFRWLEKKDRPTLRTQKLQTGRWVRPQKMRERDVFVLHRRGWSAEPIGISQGEQRAKQGIRGTLEERILYKELERRKVPFDFQSSLAGGRLMLGGMVADFILLDRPVIIRMQGLKWHTGMMAEHKDEMQKGILQGYGYIVLDIFDWQVQDPLLCEDWFRANIDVGMPARGGGVVGGMTEMMEQPNYDEILERLDHIEASLYRGVVSPEVRITAQNIQVSSLSAISANLGTVTAGTIVGATLKTSATVGVAGTGQGVLINTDHLASYSASGEMQFELDADTGVARTGTSPPYAQMSDAGMIVYNAVGGNAGFQLQTPDAGTVTDLRDCGGLAVVSNAIDEAVLRLYDSAYNADATNRRLSFDFSATTGGMTMLDNADVEVFSVITTYSTGDTLVSGLDSGDLVFQSASGQVTCLDDFEPDTDDTYYLGDYQFGWKGAIFKDTTDGKWYSLRITNGAVVIAEVVA